MFEGVISGPVPGTDNGSGFMFAGRAVDTAPDRAYEFDDDVFFQPSRANAGLNTPHALDVIPGWRAARLQRAAGRVQQV